MANKGGKTTLKRIAASKAKFVGRKDKKWLIKTSPGPHSEGNSVALGFALRNLINIAGNLKEAKIILNAGKVTVDGIVRKNPGFPVGLFDIIQFPETKKAYRVALAKKGRIEAREIKFSEKQQKLCKIVGKKALKNNVLQFASHDGKSFAANGKGELSKARVGDSILLDLPGTVSKVLGFKKGHLAVITGGKHVGETAKITEISESTMQRPMLVTLESGKESFVTVAKNVFVIGESKSAVEF